MKGNYILDNLGAFCYIPITVNQDRANLRRPGGATERKNGDTEMTLTEAKRILTGNPLLDTDTAKSAIHVALTYKSAPAWLKELALDLSDEIYVSEAINAEENNHRVFEIEADKRHTREALAEEKRMAEGR